MSSKYDFNYNFTGNMPVDTLVFVNNSVNGMLIYMFVLSFFIILSYIFIVKTDDVPLSFIRSLFATIIVSTLFYYMGKMYNLNLFSGSFLITMILVLSFSVGVLYYQRHQVT